MKKHFSTNVLPLLTLEELDALADALEMRASALADVMERVRTPDLDRRVGRRYTLTLSLLTPVLEGRMQLAEQMHAEDRPECPQAWRLVGQQVVGGGGEPSTAPAKDMVTYVSPYTRPAETQLPRELAERFLVIDLPRWNWDRKRGHVTLAQEVIGPPRVKDGDG